MVVETPNSSEGAYIPFPIPIGALEADPFASADRSLCWSDAWTGVIIGALKVLTRPETWRGEPIQIERACQQAQNLIAGISDTCGSPLTLPFACSYDFGEGTEAWFVYEDFTQTPALLGYYVAGQGFACGCEVDNSSGITQGTVSIYIFYTTPIQMTEVDVNYDLVNGVWSPGGDPLIDVNCFYSGGSVARHYQFNPAQGSDQDFGLTCSVVTVDTVAVRLKNASFTPGSGSCGSGMINSVKVKGNYPNGGTSPC